MCEKAPFARRGEGIRPPACALGTPLGRFGHARTHASAAQPEGARRAGIDAAEAAPPPAREPPALKPAGVKRAPARNPLDSGHETALWHESSAPRASPVSPTWAFFTRGAPFGPKGAGFRARTRFHGQNRADFMHEGTEREQKTPSVTPKRRGGWRAPRRRGGSPTRRSLRALARYRRRWKAPARNGRLLRRAHCLVPLVRSDPLAASRARSRMRMRGGLRHRPHRRG